MKFNFPPPPPPPPPPLRVLAGLNRPATRDTEATQTEEGQRATPAPALPSTSQLQSQQGCSPWLKKAFERKHSPEKLAQWEPGTLLVSSESGDALLQNLRLDEADIAKGGFGSVSTFKNENGDKLIGKIAIKETTDDKGNIKDDLAQELMAYQTIYSARGPHPNLVNAYGIAQVPHGKEMKRALLMDAIPGPNGSRAFDALRKCWDAGKISSEEYWGATQFIARRLLDVAEHLDQAGVVHNDIKPENFLVNENTGEPVLIDLGLWSKTDSRQRGGTPGFQPVETFRGTVVDSRSDLFSIGASLVNGIEGHIAGYYPAAGLRLREAPVKDHDGNIIHQPGFDSLESNSTDRAPFEIDEGNIIRKPGTYSAETNYTDFINGLVEIAKTDRPFIFEAKEHEFLNHTLLNDDAAKAVIKKAISQTKEENKKPSEERWKQPEPKYDDNALGERHDQVIKEGEKLKATPDLHAYARLHNIGKTHPQLKAYLDRELSDAERELANTVEAVADKYIEQAEWFAGAKEALKKVPIIPVKSGVNMNGIRRKTDDIGIDPKYADDVNRARIVLAPYTDTMKRYVDDTKQFLDEAGKLKKIDKQETIEKIGQVRERAMFARRMVEMFELLESSSTSEAERAYVQEYDPLDLFFALGDDNTDAARSFAKSVLQSQLDDDQKAELLAARNADGVPGLFMALKSGKVNAVQAYVESVLQSPLSDEQKVELLAARHPDGTSGLFFALRHDNADAVRAFIDSVLQSPLGDEQKVELLAATDADGVPGLSSVLQQGRTANPAEVVLRAEAVNMLELKPVSEWSSSESDFQSELSDEQKAELLAATDADGVPGLTNALQQGRTANAVQVYLDSVLQSPLSDEQKVELLAARRPDGTSGLFFALRHDNADAVRAFIDSVLQSPLGDEQKVELLAATDADGVPWLTNALQQGRTANAVQAYVDSVLQSQLSDEQKVELLAARSPDGASGIFFVVGNDNADAVRAFTDSVLQSQLSDEQKVELLATKDQAAL